MTAMSRPALLALLASMGVEVLTAETAQQGPPAPPAPPAPHRERPLYAPPPPLPPNAQSLPPDRARVAARPGASLRHAAASALGKLPEEGIPFQIQCLLDRQRGTVAYCESWSDLLPPMARGGADRLARAYRFELADSVRAATARPLVTTIQDRIMPGDRRGTAFLSRPLTPADRIVMARSPTAEERSFVFVPIAAEMRTTCQVQPDLSLFCVDPMPVGEPMDETTLGIFQDATLRLSDIMRAAPQLQSGANAVGAVFALTLAFDPPPRPSIVTAPRLAPLNDLVPADAEMMPFSEARVLLRPGVSLRHFVIRGRGLPTTATVINVRCEIERPHGWTLWCDVPQPQRPMDIVAAWLARAYRLLLDERARQGAGKLATIIPVTIDPADAERRRMGAARVPLSQIQYARRPTPDELTAHYPPGARPGTEARIRLDCAIQPDLEFYCVDPLVTGGEMTAAMGQVFQRAALQVSSFMRAAPTLRNGDSAVGARFELPIAFSSPAEPDAGGNASSRDPNAPTPPN